MNDIMQDLILLTKVEEDILLNGRIFPDNEGYYACEKDKARVKGLESLMEKYHYGWYIAHESLKEQIVSIIKFKLYVLTR